MYKKKKNATASFIVPQMWFAISSEDSEVEKCWKKKTPENYMGSSELLAATFYFLIEHYAIYFRKNYFSVISSFKIILSHSWNEEGGCVFFTEFFIKFFISKNWKHLKWYQRFWNTDYGTNILNLWCTRRRHCSRWDKHSWRVLLCGRSSSDSWGSSISRRRTDFRYILFCRNYDWIVVQVAAAHSEFHQCTTTICTYMRLSTSFDAPPYVLAISDLRRFFHVFSQVYFRIHSTYPSRIMNF